MAHRVAHRVAHKVAHRVAHGLAHGPRPRFCPHPIGLAEYETGIRRRDKGVIYHFISNTRSSMEKLLITTQISRGRCAPRWLLVFARTT